MPVNRVAFFQKKAFSAADGAPPTSATIIEGLSLVRLLIHRNSSCQAPQVSLTVVLLPAAATHLLPARTHRLGRRRRVPMLYRTDPPWIETCASTPRLWSDLGIRDPLRSPRWARSASRRGSGTKARWFITLLAIGYLVSPGLAKAASRSSDTDPRTDAYTH
jgi:hypothetical protein